MIPFYTKANNPIKISSLPIPLLPRDISTQTPLTWNTLPIFSQPRDISTQTPLILDPLPLLNTADTNQSISLDYRKRIYVKNGWEELVDWRTSHNFVCNLAKELPILRLINLRPGQKLSKLSTGSHYTAACLIYERGVVKDPCIHCQNGKRGKFEQCVVLVGRFSSACANCKWQDAGGSCTYAIGKRKLNSG